MEEANNPIRFGYDGADQLTSETSVNGYPPPPVSYTYDHNGNRLTQTRSGSVIQNFAYDAHDKLTAGTLNSETDGYDLNGNKTSLSFAGLSYGYTYDDEDRLIKATYPGQVNTYTYNGLGLRVGMTDSQGTHTYLCDGTSPGAPVLSDGFAVYTPGLSEHRNGSSLYYANDQLGNLWTVDGTSKNQLYYQDTSGFGTLTANAGAGTTPFKFGGGNGCQTDGDTSLVLMGHRYYDARTGRFINQDPARSGGNWYAYAGNNPVNKTDPTGLWCPTPGAWSANGGNSDDQAAAMGQADAMDQQATQFIAGLWAELAARNAAAVAQARSSGVQVTFAEFKPVFPGHVLNLSYYPIPILFDGKGANDPHYILWLPSGYASTFFTDIDFVYYGNDPSKSGGFDWRHIRAYDYAIVENAGGNGQISITMSSHYPVTFGLPYGWNPAPLSATQALNDGYIKKMYTGPVFPLPLGPTYPNSTIM